MGVIGTVLGAGRAARDLSGAVGGVAEILVGNRAERDAAAAAGFAATVGQFGAEFAAPAAGRFDRFVNALNRLPRPLLALGTLGLFTYAMAEPRGFSVRMEGLNLVPEPLWWLLGAIVSFYFGARELHHQRRRTAVATARAVLAGDPEPTAAAGAAPEPAPAKAMPVAPTLARTVAVAVDPDHNAAVEEWRRQRA